MPSSGHLSRFAKDGSTSKPSRRAAETGHRSAAQVVPSGQGRASACQAAGTCHTLQRMAALQSPAGVLRAARSGHAHARRLLHQTHGARGNVCAHMLAGKSRAKTVGVVCGACTCMQASAAVPGAHVRAPSLGNALGRQRHLTCSAGRVFCQLCDPHALPSFWLMLWGLPYPPSC